MRVRFPASHSLERIGDGEKRRSAREEDAALPTRLNSTIALCTVNARFLQKAHADLHGVDIGGKYEAIAKYSCTSRNYPRR